MAKSLPEKLEIEKIEKVGTKMMRTYGISNEEIVETINKIIDYLKEKEEVEK